MAEDIEARNYGGLTLGNVAVSSTPDPTHLKYDANVRKSEPRGVMRKQGSEGSAEDRIAERLYRGTAECIARRQVLGESGHKRVCQRCL